MVLLSVSDGKKMAYAAHKGKNNPEPKVLKLNNYLLNVQC